MYDDTKYDHTQYEDLIINFNVIIKCTIKIGILTTVETHQLRSLNNLSFNLYNRNPNLNYAKQLNKTMKLILLRQPNKWNCFKRINDKVPGKLIGFRSASSPLLWQSLEGTFCTALFGQSAFPTTFVFVNASVFLSLNLTNHGCFQIGKRYFFISNLVTKILSIFDILKSIENRNEIQIK